MQRPPKLPHPSSDNTRRNIPGSGLIRRVVVASVRGSRGWRGGVPGRRGRGMRVSRTWLAGS